MQGQYRLPGLVSVLVRSDPRSPVSFSSADFSRIPGSFLGRGHGYHRNDTDPEPTRHQKRPVFSRSESLLRDLCSPDRNIRLLFLSPALGLAHLFSASRLLLPPVAPLAPARRRSSACGSFSPVAFSQPGRILLDTAIFTGSPVLTGPSILTFPSLLSIAPHLISP